MKHKYTNFTQQEMMAVAAAREIKDGEIVIIGTGLPLLAAFLAQKTTAPNIITLYESGAYDCKPVRTPSSVVDSVLALPRRLVCLKGWDTCMRATLTLVFSVERR